MNPVFDAGTKAGFAGEPVWRNPYSQPDSLRANFHLWFAGWCLGQQQREELSPQGARRAYVGFRIGDGS